MRIVLAYDRTGKEQTVKRSLRVIIALIAATQPWDETYSAEPLGRLFFTPAQRSTLDAGKQLATPRKAEPSGPRTATLNGVVTRSDGESTVWVNGQEVSRNGTPAVNASTSASNPASARVELRGARNPRSEETRLNSSHQIISYAVFCLKKNKSPASTTPSPPI